MDYFFAACEELRHPELKQKAFVVGTASTEKKERGVVQTSNYLARSFKIKSAMPVAMAMKLKPDLVYLPSDEKFYEEESSKIVKLLESYHLEMEVMSIDEMALDTGDADYKKAMALAEGIKSRISSEVGLPCTIGISTSKIYAKMVCDAFKPNKIGMVRKEELLGFLADKDVDSISGVGGKTKERMNRIGIYKIPDIAKCPPLVLRENFGRFGPELYKIARGEDESGVEEGAPAISIGRETTMERDTGDMKKISKLVEELAKETIEELKNRNMWYRAVSGKVRYSDFSFRTKTRRLPNYTDSYDAAFGTCVALIEDLLDGKTARKVGIRLSELEPKKGQTTIKF
jgi:nucleotidyltransferase/DNA polymerase involved in DNA repair